MDGSTRIAVLISGNGSNLQALMDALNASTPRQAQIVLVVSNRPSAYGLQRAAAAGIMNKAHPWKPFKDRPDLEVAKDEYDSELARLLLEAQPQLVVCLGYLRILRPVFLQQLKDADIEILNLHPALPGEFDGMNAIERAHAAWLDGRTSRTGVMIHRVIEQVDAGEVVVKREIPFKDPDDRNLQSFEEKVHRIEWDVVVEGVLKVVLEIQQRSR